MNLEELYGLASVIAAHELDTRDEYPATPLDVDDWRQLQTVVRAQRLEPQLAGAIGAGGLLASKVQAGEAEKMHAASMATVLLLDRLLLRVAETLDEKSVPFVVLKGPAVAHLDYGDPAHRAYGDVDLLVAPGHVERARDTLSMMGGTRAFPEPRAGYDRRFGKGMAFRMPSGLEVDLHRTLSLGPFGLAVDLTELGAEQEPFAIGGQTLSALDHPRRFLHACYHAVLGRARPRIVALVDLALIAPASEREMDVVVTLARRWQADAVIEAAVTLAVSQLGWVPPTPVVRGLADLSPTDRQLRWLATYRGERRSSARLTLQATNAIGGWRERAAYLRAVLWPTNLSRAGALRRVGRGVGEWSRQRAR